MGVARKKSPGRYAAIVESSQDFSIAKFHDCTRQQNNIVYIHDSLCSPNCNAEEEEVRRLKLKAVQSIISLKLQSDTEHSVRKAEENN